MDIWKDRFDGIEGGIFYLDLTLTKTVRSGSCVVDAVVLINFLICFAPTRIKRFAFIWRREAIHWNVERRGDLKARGSNKLRKVPVHLGRVLCSGHSTGDERNTCTRMKQIKPQNGRRGER